MIKYSLILASLLFSLTLSAQRYGRIPMRYGITLEPKMSWMNPSNMKVKNNATKMAFGASIFADKFLDKNVALSVALGYNNHKGELFFTDSTAKERGLATYSLNNISMHLGAKFISNTVFKQYRFFSHIGLLPEYTISHTIETVKTPLPGYDKITPYNLSYFIELGMEYQLKKIKLLGALNFYQGVINSTGIDGKVYNSNFAVRVGVII